MRGDVAAPAPIELRAPRILRGMLTRRSFLRLTGASGLALTGTEFLARTAARAAQATSPNGSNGIEHVVILMMENHSFDNYFGALNLHHLGFPVHLGAPRAANPDGSGNCPSGTPIRFALATKTRM